MEEQLKAIQGAISDIENKVHSIFITPKCFAEEIVEMNRIYSELSNVLQEVVNETMTIPSKFLMQKILVIEFIGIINDVVKFNTQRYKTMSTFRQGALSELLKGDLQKSLSRISESITTKFEDDPAAQIPPEKRGYVEVPLDYKDHYLSQTKKYSFNKENSVVNQIQFSSLEGGSSRRVRCVAKSHNLHGSSASFSFSLSPSSQSSSSSSVKEKLDNSPLLRSPGSTKSGLTVSSPVIVASEEDTNEKEEKKAQARPSKKEKKEKVKKDKKEGLAKIKAPIFSFSKGRPRSLGNKDEFQEDISKAVAGAAAAAAAIQPPLPTATSGSAANAFDSPHSARCESSDSPAAPLSREQVVNELLSTEKAYVDGLKILISAYKAPLHQDGHIITSADSDAIFGNLEVIYNLHEKLLKSLEKDPAGDSIGKTLLPYVKTRAHSFIFFGLVSI